LRDYDKEPLIIKNRYMIKRTLVGFVCILCVVLFVMCGLYFYAIPNAIAENNTLHLRYRQIGLMGIAIGTIVVSFMICTIIRNFLKNELFIKIFNNQISYDYLTEKGEFKTFVLQKKDIKLIGWGFFPYAVLDETDRIWVTEIKAGKSDAYLSLLVNFIIYILYQFIYFVINLKFEKYVLIRFKGGIMAIPKNEYPSNENIKFEWKSLFNRHIIGGHYYGK